MCVCVPCALTSANKIKLHPAVQSLLSSLWSVLTRAERPPTDPGLSAVCSRSCQQRIWVTQMRCWSRRPIDRGLALSVGRLLTVLPNAHLSSSNALLVETPDRPWAKLTVCRPSAQSLAKYAFELLKCAVDELVSSQSKVRELSSRSVGGLANAFSQYNFVD